jgi:mono/diheme cytochrome c family protein
MNCVAERSIALLLLTGCTQPGMRDQPRHEPLEPSTMFEDGASARPEMPGTIPVGALPVEFVPPPPSRAMLEHGRSLYASNCIPCHGRLGAGDGMAVRQGFPRPEPFTAPTLLQASDERLFAVITHGIGAMPSYARLLDSQQRWAITEWVRVLQLSQHAPRELLSPDDLATLQRSES